MTDEEENAKTAEKYAKYKKSYGCIDCGVDEQYMVTAAVWKEAFPDYGVVHRERWAEGLHTCLCLSCLESRLGRKLTIRDITDAPINRSLFSGFRMGLREK